MELFILGFAALFSVINPLGTAPIFVALTQENSTKERNKISLMTSINAFVILIIAFFLGKYILSFFGITIDSLRIAGGLIITSSGFALLSGSFTKSRGVGKKEKKDASQKEDISLTPLAIPMLAGPGSISLLITLNQEHSQPYEQFIMIGSIFTVCVSIYFVLRGAHFIVSKLGATGINAISRIIGFIVIAIGIEYISSSVMNLIRSI